MTSPRTTTKTTACHTTRTEPLTLTFNNLTRSLYRVHLDGSPLDAHEQQAITEASEQGGYIEFVTLQGKFGLPTRTRLHGTVRIERRETAQA